MGNEDHLAGYVNHPRGFCQNDVLAISKQTNTVSGLSGFKLIVGGFNTSGVCPFSPLKITYSRSLKIILEAVESNTWLIQQVTALFSTLYLL